jgi:molybdopterin-containing oxidoreductase family membrane subunit
LFIALSLSYGLAIFLLVLVYSCSASGRSLGDALLKKFARLQVIFIAAALYFVVVYHLTNLYFTKHHDFERFLLLEGGVYTALFWLGQVLLGSVLPMLLLTRSKAGQLGQRMVVSTALVVVGGFAQMYVTIIGGQAFPLIMFPGRQVSSSFFDGVIHPYAPSLPEWLLGFGGLAIAGLIVMLALKMLDFLPERLDDDAMQAEFAAHKAVSA